ncbi:hypothetical protein JW865_04560 [Candidatus Bathyarchaeota archaeon]|nr:hypothetical protein [Candidatus Bathyarchaeota archaeon]
MKLDERKIIAGIKNTGVPFEIEVGGILEENGWNIAYGDIYDMPHSDLVGEIDVIAEKTELRKNKNGIGIGVKYVLIVECKDEKKHPWVFFDNYFSRGSIPDKQLIGSKGYSLSNQLDRKSLFHHYIKNLVHRSNIELFKKTTTSSQIFKAIKQVTSPLEYNYIKQESIAPKTIFIYPCIITKTPIISAHFETHEKITTKEEKRILVEWKGYFIDVLNFAGLPDFLTTITKDFRSFCKLHNLQ